MASDNFYQNNRKVNNIRHYQLLIKPSALQMASTQVFLQNQKNRKCYSPPPNPLTDKNMYNRKL